MCAHTAAAAQAAAAKISNILQPQLDAIAEDTGTLNDLSSFYKCESARFEALSGFAGQYNVNGAPIDSSNCALCSKKLSADAATMEEYKAYLDTLKQSIEAQIEAEQAIVDAGNTDCAACIAAWEESQKYYKS